MGENIGAAARARMITGAHTSQGDVILGLASSGLHSNGFSLVRKILEKDSGTYAAKDLLTPTRIYVKSILEALKVKSSDGAAAIHGMAHITGGGFSENIPRVLPKTLAADIDYTSWELPPVFRWLQELGGMTDAELHRTFNCGIGMVAVVSPGDDADAVTAHLSGQGIETRAIGTIQDA